MYITILLTWFRVHYKISNNNTYTYSSDTKSGLYKKKKKKKKKSHSVCPSERKKNLTEFENLSLFLSKWDFFSHKNLGPELSLQMGSRRKSFDFFKSSQTIVHISTTNLWFETIWQTSTKKYVVSISYMKSNECKLFQQNVKK